MKIRDIASVSESATDTDGDNNNDVALNVYTRSARTPSLSETDVALRSKLHGSCVQLERRFSSGHTVI